MPQLTPAMPPQRIDLGELKSQLAMRLGPERARRYFGYLHQLLSQKLSKGEFDKLCLSTIGRENVPLHNHLIRSVIKNACLAKVPPPPPLKKGLQREDNPKPPHPQAWSNQEYLPQSPRRRRSATHRSKLGLNESPDISALENGELRCLDLKRRLEGGDDDQAEQPEKIRRLDSIGDEGRPLEAPLGIPSCPASLNRAKRSVPPAGSTSTCRFRSFSDGGELCNTEDLRVRMERIAEKHGLGGVELESANLLNHGLDAYLKQLIKSSVELARTRADPEAIKQQPAPKQKACEKPANGVWLDSSAHMHEERKGFLITLQDFTVAMKLNPHQLGQDASLWLEKITFHSFE